MVTGARIVLGPCKYLAYWLCRGVMEQPLYVLCWESSSHWNDRRLDRSASTSMDYDFGRLEQGSLLLDRSWPRNRQMPIKRDSDVEDYLTTKPSAQLV